MYLSSYILEYNILKILKNIKKYFKALKFN